MNMADGEVPAVGGRRGGELRSVVVVGDGGDVNCNVPGVVYRRSV